MPLDYKQFGLLGLNSLLLLGGVAVQLPQIIKILHSKSALGLSETSWILQSFSTGVYVCFNHVHGYPFMTWGDTFFAVIEYVVIVSLIWIYGEPNKKAFWPRLIAASIFITLAALSYIRAVPPWLLYIFGVAPMPMIIVSRLPQILLNYRQKHTGQLALPSLLMQVTGNSARLISSMAMVPDRLILASHATATLFNGTVLFQILYYWRRTQEFTQSGVTKKNDQKNDGFETVDIKRKPREK